jgi:hypothetical protein
MVFSLWMAGATGAQAVQQGTVLILIGIPVYVVTRRTNASRRSGAGRHGQGKRCGLEGSRDG